MSLRRVESPLRPHFLAAWSPHRFDVISRLGPPTRATRALCFCSYDTIHDLSIDFGFAIYYCVIDRHTSPSSISGFFCWLICSTQDKRLSCPLETLHIRAARRRRNTLIVVIPTGRGMQTPVPDLQYKSWGCRMRGSHPSPFGQAAWEKLCFLYDIHISLWVSLALVPVTFHGFALGALAYFRDGHFPGIAFLVKPAPCGTSLPSRRADSFNLDTIVTLRVTPRRCNTWTQAHWILVPNH